MPDVIADPDGLAQSVSGLRSTVACTFSHILPNNYRPLIVYRVFAIYCSINNFLISTISVFFFLNTRGCSEVVLSLKIPQKFKQTVNKLLI